MPTTTTRTTTKTIESYERLRLSRNGNPRFRFTFTDGTILDSSSDAAWCYEIGNRGMREGSTVEMTFTRAGKIAVMRETTA
jgi:hypothetical protein